MTSRAPRRSAASPLAIAVGLLTLYFVWGSTYVGIRVAVETMPAFVMASARFLTAGLLLLAYSLFREGRTALTVSRVELRDSFIVGALLLGGGMGMVALGEESVPSGVAALLIALMPLWVAVLGRIVFGERVSRLVVTGIGLGLVGVAILVAPTGGTLAFSAGGIVAVLISPLSWAIGSLYSSHRARLPRRPLFATALQMLFGSAVLLGLGLVTGEFVGFAPATITASSWFALGYLVVIGSVIGFTTYVWLLRVAPLPKIATYAYVNPIVAFILSAILLGEEISVRTVVAAIVIVAGVALIVTARGRSAHAAPEPVEASEAGEPAIDIAGEPIRA